MCVCVWVCGWCEWSLRSKLERVCRVDDDKKRLFYCVDGWKSGRVQAGKACGGLSLFCLGRETGRVVVFRSAGRSADELSFYPSR